MSSFPQFLATATIFIFHKKLTQYMLLCTAINRERVQKRYRYLYIIPYRETPTRSGLRFEVAYWPAMTLGVTAQIAATLLKRTDFGPRSLQLDRLTYAQPSALWPNHFNLSKLTSSTARYKYQQKINWQIIS